MNYAPLAENSLKMMGDFHCVSNAKEPVVKGNFHVKDFTG